MIKAHSGGSKMDIHEVAAAIFAARIADHSNMKMDNGEISNDLVENEAEMAYAQAKIFVEVAKRHTQKPSGTATVTPLKI